MKLGVITILAAALVVAGAGCGGASTTLQVASVSATTTTAAASPGSPQQQALAFARCMRAHGMPGFPDPSPRGGFVFPAGAGLDPRSPTMRAAQASCRQFMPGADMTGHPTAQWLAHMLAVARCMRRHGVPDFPDPRTSVPADPFASGFTGVISDIEGAILVFPSSIDTHSPAFVRAASACGFPLHNH